MSETLPTLREPRGLATAFDKALYWLEQARSVPDAKVVIDDAERLKLLARQAKDKTAQANAAELMMRAQRKLGELLIAAREAGQLSAGGRPKKGPGQPQAKRITLDDAGIDRKLAMKAQDLARRPLELFERVVSENRDKILAGKPIVINPNRDLSKAEKQVRRQIKLAQLIKKQQALPQKVHTVIYADPEWKFETWSEEGLDRAAENHYPTSDLATIKARPVGQLAASDAVLFLWATVPMLPQALEVMRFWGFAYVSHFCWDKVTEGTGYWNRNRHELLLVGTRGNIPAPVPGTQWPSLISSPAGAHSAKPDWAYELIEDYFPGVSRIELNARPPRRPGWDVWGYEAPEDEADSAEAVAAPSTAVPAVPLPRFAGEDEENSELQASVLPTSPAEPGGVDQGDDPASPVSADGDDSPSALDRYRALVAADTNKGRHTRETAADIIRASRACDPIIPVKQLADDLGHPLGTVQGWTHKLKVTDHARLTETARHATAVQQARRGEALEVTT